MTLAVAADSGQDGVRFRHVSAADLGCIGSRRLLIRHKRRRDGPLAVARVIPAGHARARTQRGWLEDVVQHPKMLLRRADAQANIMAVAWVLAAHASWETMLTRPTWDVLMERTGLRRSTVATHLAWLRSVGLLGLVAGGTTPELSPGILRGADGQQPAERNEAAVYVLCASRHLRLVAVAHPEDAGAEYVDDGRDADEDELPSSSANDPLSGSPVDTTRTPTPSEGGKNPRTRENEIPNGAGLRPALKTPLPMSHPPGTNPAATPPWPLTSTPAGRKDRHAAEALQAALPVLCRISTAHVAHLAREWFLAGWTPGDILTALGRRPDGTPWHHSDAIRHIPGWFRHRLDAWRTTTADGSGPILPSPSQRATAEQHRLRALARARAETAAATRAASTAPAPEAAVWVDRVRAELRAARARRGPG